MNVWIDICHTPQYNFYKNFILKLADEGNNVMITVLDRGKTPVIIKRELQYISNVSIDVIGKHRLNKLSAVLEANIYRLVKLFKWASNRKIDIGFSNAYPLSCVCWFKKIPCYTFDDDPQTIDYKPKIWFSNLSHYCLYEVPKEYKLSSKVKVLKALKEWSYLSPSVFKADIKALDEYNLKPKTFIFLREVSVGTVNYTGQASGAILNVKDLLPKDKKVIFSLEDKSKRDMYPSDWILLQEPVKDIHSLIFYSAALVSSGDSMAREAALLGVPSYYLGIRHSMPANIAASKVAGLKNEVSMPFERWIESLESKTTEELIEKQQETIKNIDNTFTDINEYIWGLLYMAY